MVPTDKLLLVYKDSEGIPQIESVWASKVNDFYRIENIPFFAKNLAYGDLVSVEHDKNEGALYFESLVKPSGHSTVRLFFFDPESASDVLVDLEKLGCNWEENQHAELYAVDIPEKTDYMEVKTRLEELLKKGVLDYEEACLGFVDPDQKS